MQDIYDFNYDWQYYSHTERGITSKNFGIEGEHVSIPHYPRIEALDVLKPYVGVMYYRKNFKIPTSLASKKIFIDFEGVMTKARVYVNGVKLATHYGGYLPFSVDITRHIKMNETNVICVEVDNRDNVQIPPGKPTDGVDFLYFGGIYRSVSLRALDNVYIDKPVTKNGGGVFVCTDRIDSNTAYLSVDATVVNSYFKPRRVYVREILLDADGNKITEVESRSQRIDSNREARFSSKMVVTEPILWDTASPYLYTLRTEVYVDDELIDVVDTVTGIRTVAVSEDGFLLNGEVVRLNGANRHQQYPYVGIACSDNADRRDMRLLKEAGFNSVRLSHYPQSEALMDECDRLGLLVIVPTPGWQHCTFGPFRKRVLENIRDMVRRDRNHPSAVIWEASLNETGFWMPGATDSFFKKCVDVVREEFAPHTALVCGDTLGRKHWKNVGYDIPFTGWDNENKLRPLDAECKGLTREYGDYEFGGHNSTTRAAIADGEVAMRVQAFNFQWSHNMNRGSKYELGDLIWEGIDHNRGMGKNKPVSTSGILNEWRMPKYAYYFYKSQNSKYPIVYIPTYWDGETNGKVTVYSNAEEVELLINGRNIARQRPNSGTTELYSKKKVEVDNSVDYWKKGGEYDINNKNHDLAKFVLSRMDKGGDCVNLEHAPFTFEVPFEAGEIEARAYIDGKVVATHVVRTPGDTVSLKIEADTVGYPLVADGRDKVFVRVYALDKNGTVVHNTTEHVYLNVEGGTIHGMPMAEMEAGVASYLVSADIGVDSINIEARSARGMVTSAVIETEQVVEDTRYI